MIKKTCAASDCEKAFIVKVPRSKYCSDKCRSREHKRSTYAERTVNGKCPQCGGKLTVASPTHKEIPTYCKSCQEYYQERYISSRDKSDT